MKRSELIFNISLIPLDFLMFIAAGVSAYFLRTHSLIAQFRPVYFSANMPFEKYIWLVLAYSFFGVIVFAFSGLYRLKVTRSSIEEFFHIIAVCSALIMAMVVFIFLKREWFDSRFIILAVWIFSILFITLERILFRLFQKFLIVKYNVGVRNILVIGKDQLTEKVINAIRKHPASGYKIAKTLKQPDIEEVSSSVSSPGVNEIILADPNYPKEKIVELIDFCNENRIGFKFVPNLFQTLTTNIGFDTFTGVPLVELKRTSLEGWGTVIKRVLDMIGSFFGLILLSPLFLIIGIVIKMDSKGPVFVKLKRVSRGEAFDLYKFRSMINNAHLIKYKELMKYNERKDGPLFKMKNDPRITRVGRILRKTRIDEFPQLFNVLKGKISLVGPRPHEPEEIAKYEKHHKTVLAIKAGITGLPQISGSSDLPFEEEVKLDTYYIENWSLLLDLKILLKTFFILFQDKSAA